MNTRALIVLSFGTLLNVTYARHNIIVRTPRTFRGARVAIINTNDNQNHHEIIQVNSMQTDTTLSPGSGGLKNKPYDHSSSFWDSVTNHKLLTLLGVFTLGCCCIAAYVMWAEHRIQHAQSWSCWQPSAAPLTSLTAEQVAPALFSEIKNRYYKQGQTLIHVIDPLVCFMQDCDRELAYLASIIKIRSYCSKIPVINGFINNETAINNAYATMQRLEFLKQALVTHISDYTPDERLGLTHA